MAPTGDERIAIYEDVESVVDELGLEGLKVVLEACAAIATGEADDEPDGDDAGEYRELAEALEGII